MGNAAVANLTENAATQWNALGTSVQYAVYAMGALCCGEIIHQIMVKLSLPDGIHVTNPWCWIRKFTGLGVCEGFKNFQKSLRPLQDKDNNLVFDPKGEYLASGDSDGDIEL